MTYPISDVTRRVVYSGSAGAGPYNFTFEILTQTDIAVYKNSTLLTLTTDYTVTINANGTGSITLVSAAISTDRITIVGDRGIQRTTDFVTGGDLFANTLNQELDALTIYAQQVDEKADRGLKAPVTDPTDIAMTLPSKTARANKNLAFDANGNPTTGEVIGDNRGNWAAGVVYNKRDIVKDTSNGNIYYCNTAHTSSGSQPISTNADSAKWDLLVDNASAGASATAAAASASAASTSASNASTSATNSASSASTASTQASNASTSATNAASSATAASGSASTASTAATNASNSATAAATSATNASNSASSASTSASNAASSASAASTSASNASTSATNAANSATSASNSASTATTQATNAASSASSAASAQTAAEAARDQTLTAFDNFDDRYLGSKTSDPTVDNDGNPLVAGSLYFNSSTGVMKVYTGSVWVAAYVSGTDFLAKANNLSDLTSASTARTNLGLAIGTDVLAPNGSGASLTNLNASNLATGTVGTARLASGTANSTTYLRGDQTWATVAGYTGSRGQVFTSSGTFTVPSSITTLKVTVVGGGGGGGASSGGCSSGAGGGGGGAGTSIRYVTGLTPGGTVSVTVGAAGTGGTGAGGNGGASSFGTFATGNGGSGGGTGFAGGTGAAGANGTATTGDINLTGYRPSINTRAGGQAYFLSQATDGVPGIAQAGIAGGGYGSGGTGSSSNAGTFNGGAGAPGIVVVEW